MPQLNIRLDPELARRLEELRRERKISISHLVRLAIEEKVGYLLTGGSLPPNPLRGRAAVLARLLDAQEAAPRPTPKPRPKRTPKPVLETVEKAKPAPTPPAAPVPRLWVLVDQFGDPWAPVDAVTHRLGIETNKLLGQLDPEDFQSHRGETCITSFGIQTAIAIALSEDIDTSEFELELERATQAN